MKDEAERILERLIQHYGKSKYYDWVPRVCFDDEDSILSGEFRPDWEAIVLYPSSICFGVEQLATVICHEYIHYMQSPTWLTRYSNIHEYYDNPYEVEAYGREEEWRNFIKL